MEHRFISKSEFEYQMIIPNAIDLKQSADLIEKKIENEKGHLKRSRLMDIWKDLKFIIKEL
jgi:hypothetical protein